MKIFFLFYFFSVIQSLSIYIQNQTNCLPFLQNGSFSNPFCSLINGFLLGENFSIESNQTEINYILLSNSYEINDEDLITNQSIFSKSSNKSINISSLQDSIIIINTFKIKFTISANLSIKSIIFKGGSQFVPNKSRNTYILNGNTHVFYSLFEFLESKTMKNLLMINSGFHQMNLVKNGFFSTIIKINDYFSSVSFMNCSFKDMFLSHNIIYLSQKMKFLSINPIAIEIMNSSFLNYNPLDNIIIFKNFIENDNTLNYKYIFSFIEEKTTINCLNILIRNLSFFSIHNKSVIVLRNFIIKNSVSALEPLLFSLNSSVMSIYSCYFNYSNPLVYLNQNSVLIIKYFFIQNSFQICNFISMNSYDTLNLEYLFFDNSITDSSFTSKSFIKILSNCSVFINNTMFTNVMFFLPLMSFIQENNVSIYNLYLFNYITKNGKPVFYFKYANNLLMKSIFLEKIQVKSFIYAYFFTNPLSISLLNLTNYDGKIDFFIECEKKFSLLMDAIFNNITINSVVFSSFFTHLLFSNVTINNSQFIDLYFDFGFLEMNSSILVINNSKFFNIQNGISNSKQLSSDFTGWFFKLSHNSTLNLLSTLFFSFTTDTKLAKYSVFIKMQQNNKLFITNMTWVKISQYTTFLFASTENFIYIDNIFIEGIWVNFSRSLFQLETSNVIYIAYSTFFSIKSLANGVFMYMDRKNDLWIKNSTIKGVISEVEGKGNNEGKGGCFSLKNENRLQIFYSNLSNMASIYGALGYFLYRNKILIYSSNFDDFFASKNAGGFFLTEKNYLMINSSNFSNFKANHDSGMIFLTLNNNVYIQDILLKDSFSSLCGGSIYGLTDNIVNISSSSFVNSMAVLSGGLFYFASSNIIFLERNIVKNCSSLRFSYAIDLNRFNHFNANTIIWQKSGGIYNGYMGVVMGSGWDLDYKDWNYTKIEEWEEKKEDFNIFIGFYCLFSISQITIKNYEKSKVFFTDFCNITLFNMKIMNNSLREGQSLFDFRNGEVNISHLSFSNMTGDIFSISHCKLQLIVSKFIGLGYRFFSAIESNIQIYGSSFIYHHNALKWISNKNGGFFEIFQCDFKMKNSLIVGGFALNGGAFSLIDTKLYFSNNICLLNKAVSDGGCMYITNNQGEIHSDASKIYQLKQKKNLYIANMANSGGALFLKGNSKKNFLDKLTYKLLSDKEIFRGNTANNGGAIYKDEMSEFLASDLRFIDNRAINFNNSYGKGGAFYANCFVQCFRDNEFFFNFLFKGNKASFGGAIYLKQNPTSSFTSTNILRDKINFLNNKALFYGNDVATIPAKITLITRDSFINEQRKAFTNLISGKKYQCLFYVIAIDYFVNIVTKQENLLDLEIHEKNNNSLHQLLLEPDYNNLLCAKNTLISNPRPNLNLIYEIYYIPQFQAESKFTKLTINFVFRPCEMGERQTDDFRCESCLPGFYSFHKNSSEKCLPCEQNSHFYCLGSSYVGPKEGYWRMDYFSDNFIRCPNPASCLGYYVSDPAYFEKDYSTGLCRTGYSGVLCAECAEGYGITHGYYCTSCSSFWYYFNLIFFFVFRLFVIIYSLHSAVAMCTSAAAGLLKTKEIVSATIMKILMNHFQMLSIIVSFPFEWKQSIFDILSVGMAVSPSISESYSVQCLFQGFHIHISTHFVKIVNIWLSILFLMAVCYAYHRFYLTKKIKFYLKFIKKTENDVLESTYFIILFIVYLDIVSVCLETFSCRNIGYGNIQEYRLIKDYSVKCFNENHKGWAYGLVVPFFVLFGLGFPISIFYTLIQKKTKKKLNRPESMLRYGYFYLSYEREYFYWDFVILIRKILLTSVNIFILGLYTGVFSYIVTIMLMILLFFLYVQIECQPYLKKELKSVNNLEKYSLISLSGTMFLAIFGYDQAFSGTISLVLFIVALCLNVIFFMFWFILYYESDFRKTLKTIWYFSTLCLTFLYNKISNSCRNRNLQVNFFKRRRGILKDEKKIIFFDLERYFEEMKEIEVEDQIKKLIPPKNFHLQLDFEFFSLENSGVLCLKNKKTVRFKPLHSNISHMEITSSESIEFNKNNRDSKFFTIDAGSENTMNNQTIIKKTELEVIL